MGIILNATLAALLVLNAAYLEGLYIQPALGARALVWLGRSPVGPSNVVVAAYDRRLSQKAFEERLIKQSALLAQKDGYQLMRTPYGDFWEPDIGHGSAAIAQMAEFDAKYSGFAGNPIHRGDVVLDCGANIGTFTRRALMMGAATVVAIEPAPNNVESLRRNFQQEIRDGKVIVYEKGVWDKDDFLVLSINDKTSAMDSFVIHEGARGVKVPLTTIDKLVHELGLPRVDFIKMDIEGAERRALDGGSQTIAQFRPRLEISVNHLPDDPEVVPQVVSRRQHYEVEYLECELNRKTLAVRPEILFFH
jgi:FkbM family methyltransferase